jgi:hypothetical protein
VSDAVQIFEDATRWLREAYDNRPFFVGARQRLHGAAPLGSASASRTTIGSAPMRPISRATEGIEPGTLLQLITPSSELGWSNRVTGGTSKGIF